MKKAVGYTWIGCVLLFLYAPIAVMIGLSFNASVSRANWGGFTLDWYRKLLDSPAIIQALKVTLEVAVLAALISTVLGTLAAIGMYSSRGGMNRLITSLSYVPMTSPDVVTGVSMMLMFIFVNVPLGKMTMLLAHITFDTPYVVFNVLPRLKQMNPNLYEAACDLGCTPRQAMTKVILPEIMPGVTSGMLMAFTMSLDDFVISYFTSNLDQNLSMIVYSSARKGVEPTMYALSACIFVTVLVLLMITNRKSSLETMK
ncbi:MAG: ABC transporter permease [Clostridia bacterium]|nr:ABC transporter permease [Clostridia bacterium]